MSLVQSRPYVLLMAGSAASALGARSLLFAVPLVVLSLTSDPITAGVSGAMSSVGFLLGGVALGPLVDLKDRRLLLIVNSGVATAASAAAAVTVSVGAPHADLMLLMVSLIVGAATATIGPIDTSVFRSVLSQEQFPAAISSLQVRNSSIALIGAPIGGALVGLGYPLPMLVAAGLFMVTAAMAIPLCIPPQQRGSDLGRPRHRTSDVFLGGWRCLLGDPVLRVLFPVSTLANLSVSTLVFALVLGFQRDGVPPALIGLLEAAMGGAMLAGSVLSLRITRQVPTGWLFILSSAMFALATVAIVISPTVWVAVVALAGAALPVPSLNASATTLITLRTPTKLVGRVTSAAMTTSTALGAAAPLVAGALVAHLSTRMVMIAILAAILTLTLSGFARPVRTARYPSHPAGQGET